MASISEPTKTAAAAHHHDLSSVKDETTPLVEGATTSAVGFVVGSNNPNNGNTDSCETWIVCTKLVLCLVVIGCCGVLLGRWTYSFSLSPKTTTIVSSSSDSSPSSQQQQQLTEYYNFPDDFTWGSATSSYQIEGAVNEDGRGQTIWDTYCRQNGTVSDNTTGDVACDSYHRIEQDVQLMKSLGLKAYRFSIAWSRIVPSGTASGEDGKRGINPLGIQYYSRLIDLLIANDIEPWITMYHWDLPQTLQDRYGGWMSAETVTAFADYARILFQNYGDRVKHWITINEAWTVAVNGYASGIHAPGFQSSTQPYVVGHHLLFAHARAVQVYRTEFATSDGIIGMANCADYRYPREASNLQDRKAAERAMLFQFGWFTEPLITGAYPNIMRERLGKRLPQFTTEEQALLIGSYDFIGVNYYSSYRASDPLVVPTYEGYWGSDVYVNFTNDPTWQQNDMGWNAVPDGLRLMLNWISNRYNSPTLYVTENGSAEHEADMQTALADTRRKDYIEQHVCACGDALEDDDSLVVNLKGYFAWSLMDNFEWQFGYTKRFGLCYTDFETLERTPKSSGIFYSQIIESNGQTLEHKRHRQRRRLAAKPATSTDTTTATATTTSKWWQWGMMMGVSALPIGVVAAASRGGTGGSRAFVPRQLPEKLLIGYGSDCNKVKQAVQDGVNVVIWSFLDIVANPNNQEEEETTDERRLEQQQCENTGGIKAKIHTSLDLNAIRHLIQELDDAGYDDTVHLASFGGWNGPHLDANLSASEWCTAYKQHVGDIFHGVDWDLEGHDDLNSPTNYFTMDCLKKMGAISKTLKEDGYIVGMAPPQSYLDFHGSGRFSRYVNLTEPDRQWHPEFHYFGANVYSYLLLKFGDYIDFVSMQFYESYSKAGMSLLQDKITPAEYLQRYIETAKDHDGYLNFVVDFSDDHEVDIMNKQTIRLPLSKLVFGFANGWADDDESDKTLYVTPQQINTAWKALESNRELPRGLMFWTINEEGEVSNGVSFARELSQILNNR